MRAEDCIDTNIQDVICIIQARSKEAVGHVAILEETTGGLHVELSISLATIDKECHGKHRFGICRKETRGGKGEGGVCRNRILNALEPKFTGNSEIIISCAKAVAEVSKLLKAKE